MLVARALQQQTHALASFLSNHPFVVVQSLNFHVIAPIAFVQTSLPPFSLKDQYEVDLDLLEQESDSLPIERAFVAGR